jgi:hypothetical protein
VLSALLDDQGDNETARSVYDRIARFNGFIRYDYALE